MGVLDEFTIQGSVLQVVTRLSLVCVEAEGRQLQVELGGLGQVRWYFEGGGDHTGVSRDVIISSDGHFSEEDRCFDARSGVALG